MEQSQIAEGNKIIGLFKEGFTEGDKGYLLSKPDKYFEEVLCYHKDWSLLMPVVEKIEGLKENIYHYTVLIEGNKCSIFKRIGNEQIKSTYKAVSTSSEAELKITAVFQAVVKFIQWYNKNQNP